MAVATLRQMAPGEIRCPAGELKGDVSCWCAVEGGAIDGRMNPQSIEAFCAGDYRACPSWQTEKDRLAAGKAAGTAVAEAKADGMVKKAHADARKLDRYARARHLMTADTDEARRFRARVAAIPKPTARAA